MMCVIAEFKPEEILPFSGPGANEKTFTIAGKSYNVHMYSERYATFRRSLECQHCGVKGAVMRLEYHRSQTREPVRPHFNLYAIGEDGKAVLMTKDHIKPKSRGGSDALSNLQTLCQPCNVKKGDTYGMDSFNNPGLGNLLSEPRSKDGILEMVCS